MPRIRSEFHIRRSSATAGEAIDISSYDRLGKYGMDNKAFLSNAGEIPDFLFTESADDEAVVSLAHFGGAGLAVQLKLSGSGSKGSHLTAGSDGLIVASSTDSANPIAEGEIGIALADWEDGDSVECELFRV